MVIMIERLKSHLQQAEGSMLVTMPFLTPD